MKLQESAEDYLETILILSHKGQVRSVDIANELNYKKSSVSVAMKNLRTTGYITMDEKGYISLTSSGQEVAESMYERHVLISDWLIFLGVEKEIAVEDACRMEHTMSDQSFKAIKNHIEEWKQAIYQQKLK